MFWHARAVRAVACPVMSGVNFVPSTKHWAKGIAATWTCTTDSFGFCICCLCFLLMQVHEQVLIRRVNQVYFIRYDDWTYTTVWCSQTRQLATEGKHGQTCSYHSLAVKYGKILLASIFASGEAVSAWRASLNLRFALLWAATFSMS